MKEREIDLLEVIWDVLLNWRVLVVWMLVGGVMLGGFSYVNSARKEKEQLNAKVELEQELQERKDELEQEKQDDGLKKDITLEYLEQKLTVAQINDINVVVNYEKYASDRQQYIDESILMQVDALKIPQNKLTFMVRANDEEQIADIVRIYEDMISNSLIEWLGNETEDGYAVAYYSEVISFDRNSRHLEQGSNSFSINVVHVTEKLCTKLADLIEKFMHEQQEALQKQLGTHTIEVINRSFTHVSNASLLSTQLAYQNEVTTYTSAAEKQKETWGAHEKKYYELLTSKKSSYKDLESDSAKEGEERDEANENELKDIADLLEATVVTPATINTTYVILGMMAFALIYASYIFIKCMFNGRLRRGDDVNRIYGIPQLALIPAKEEKRKFDFVDKWILKIHNMNKRVFTEAEAIGLASVAVKMAVKKEEIKEVYFLGCDVQERTENIAAQISEILNKENISLILLNNVLYNQETMEKLQDAKAVVLIEKAGATLYEEIAEELELLKRQEIKTLGAVIVE